MSNLVTITSKFYDKSGHRIINLNVKSRYKESTKENLQNTDEKGFFIFHASPNRTIEILAKPPNTSDYKVFKTINSSIVSSEFNPIKVQLPKTIEEYKTGKVKQPTNGTVITLFKVIDSKGKVMVDFPVQSRPKGKKAFERSTNKDGIVEIESSPNREIEISVLTSSDGFVLKKSVNSGNGSQQPILIKLDEPYDNFKILFTITLLDRNNNNYIVEKTNVEILALESREKNIITTSNGKIVVRGHIGKWVRITVYKPDGTPLKPINYLPKIINESSVKLHLDVDVTIGSTAKSEPNINRKITENITCETCGKSLKLDIDFIKTIAPKAKEDFQNALLNLPKFLKKYSSNTCKDLVHILTQGQVETQNFTALIESMRYTTKSYTGKSLYNMMKTNFGAAFKRHGMESYTLEQRYKYVAAHFLPNDPAIAQFLYSVPQYPNKNYRGRGLIHLTHFSTYVKCAKVTGLDIEKNPELLQTDFNAAIESATWFWKDNKISRVTAQDSSKIDNDLITNKVTVKVNVGMKQATERRTIKLKIAQKFIAKYGECK